jgi:phage shock protein PspC (stress-responsive transcriptional regulator)/predicted membrane protein
MSTDTPGAGTTADPSAAPPPPPPPPDGPRHRHRHRGRLRRSTSDRVVAGVAAGIGDAIGIDPNWVRVGFVLSSFFGGAGLIAYAVLWVLLPGDDGSEPIVRTRRHDPALWGGLALLFFGVTAVLGRVLPGGRDGFDIFWPLVLIAAGVGVLVMRANDAPDAPDPLDAPGDDPARATTAVAMPPVPPSPPGVTSAMGPTVTSTATTEGTAEGTDTAATAETPVVNDDATTPTAWAPVAQWPTPPRPPAPPWPPTPPPRPRPRRSRRPSFLGPLTVSALLLLVGVAALLSAVDAVDVDPAVVASIALMVIGVALCVGAFFGRARGLILLGVLATLVAGVLATIDVPVRGGIGERNYAPQEQHQIKDEYRLGIGQLDIDFRGVDWRAESTQDVDVRLGIGEARITVPPDVDVVVDGHAGMGNVELAGRQQDGVDADDTVRLRAQRSVVAPARLHIDADVGIGHLLVVREPEGTR